MKLYPALDVDSSAEMLLALVDDFSPTAVEEGAGTMRLFFVSADARDAACAELHAHGYTAAPLEVSDDDWARRSQEGLAPVTVGRITIFPSPESRNAAAAGQRRERTNPESQIPDAGTVSLVVTPSMGFGTGHHATTRLCLRALQRAHVQGAFVLDVGTGSGVLAIACDLLGAKRTLGIDSDADAVQSARENLDMNPAASHSTFELSDLTMTPLPEADVVTANLTGALLVRSAATLLTAVRPGGTLILSGILAEEVDMVRGAFAGATAVSEERENEWVCLCLAK